MNKRRVVLAAAVWLVVRRVSIGADSGSPASEDSDPIAEADFYLAYGKYDDAAAILNQAMASNPPTPDLMYKLLQVRFVANNADDFLADAHDYKRQFGRSGDWETICTMGRELMPHERLFR